MRIGVICDWDGVIVDSAHLHERSWELLAAEEGLELVEGHFAKGFGMKNEIVIPNILRWTDDRERIAHLSKRKEQLYRQLLMKEELPPCDGAIEFLKLCRTLGIPCAIGSSTEWLNIEMILERLEIGYCFDAIVTGDDVTASKPNPQVFLLAAEKIGCKPRDCVVFEDAPAGIAAAHNGGMKAVGVTTTHPAYALTDADIVVHSLREIGRSQIEGLFTLRAGSPVAS